jgi:hypothetical protein
LFRFVVWRDVFFLDDAPRRRGLKQQVEPSSGGGRTYIFLQCSRP